MCVHQVCELSRGWLCVCVYCIDGYSCSQKDVADYVGVRIITHTLEASQAVPLIQCVSPLFDFGTTHEL